MSEEDMESLGDIIKEAENPAPEPTAGEVIIEGFDNPVQEAKRRREHKTTPKQIISSLITELIKRNRVKDVGIKAKGYNTKRANYVSKVVIKEKQKTGNTTEILKDFISTTPTLQTLLEENRGKGASKKIASEMMKDDKYSGFINQLTRAVRAVNTLIDKGTKDPDREFEMNVKLSLLTQAEQRPDEEKKDEDEGRVIVSRPERITEMIEMIEEKLLPPPFIRQIQPEVLPIKPLTAEEQVKQRFTLGELLNTLGWRKSATYQDTQNRLREFLNKAETDMDFLTQMVRNYEERIGFKLRDPPGFKPIRDKLTNNPQYLEELRQQAVGMVLIRNSVRADDLPIVGVGTYCGPNTPVFMYVAQDNKKPVNELDSYCREHDILYTNSNTPDQAREADDILRDKIRRLKIQPVSSIQEIFKEIEQAYARITVGIPMGGKGIVDDFLSMVQGAQVTTFVGSRELPKEQVDSILQELNKLEEADEKQDQLEIKDDIKEDVQEVAEEPRRPLLQTPTQEETASEAETEPEPPSEADSQEGAPQKPTTGGIVEERIESTEQEKKTPEALLRPELIVADPTDFEETPREIQEDNERWEAFKVDVETNPNASKGNPLWNGVLEEMRIRFQSPLILLPGEKVADLKPIADEVNGDLDFFRRLLYRDGIGGEMNDIARAVDSRVETTGYQFNALGVGGVYSSNNRKTIDDNLFKPIMMDDVVDTAIPVLEDLFLNARNTNTTNGRYNNLTDIVPIRGVDNQKLYID